MKQTYYVILAFLFFILACEKNDDNELRNSYILAGDNADIKYIDFNPDLIFNSGTEAHFSNILITKIDK